MDSLGKTKKAYGFLWKESKDTPPMERWHFNSMQEVITEPIVRGSTGIDVGCGCGYDTYIMAKNNPLVKMVSVDLSDGVYAAKRITSALSNVCVLQCSITDMPIKDNIFDFAYSFGVLHHTVNPRKCLLEISRVLKKDGPVFLYLYEDHADNPLKFIALKMITGIRGITVMFPSRGMYLLSWIFSPVVFILFTLPAKILKHFRATQGLAGKMPFNFGTGIFSLRGDLYDRFSAPIEYRFSKQGLYDMFAECGFSKVRITRLKDTAGWVAWAYK